MSVRRLPLPLLVTLVLLLAAAAPAARAAHERLRPGDPVRFVLQTDHGVVTSKRLLGRAYAVVFWNFRSQKFREHAPALAELARELKPRGFVLLGYYRGAKNETPATTDRARGALRWPGAVPADQRFPFYELFYTRRAPVPGAFLVSAEGRLLWHGPLSQLPEKARAAAPGTGDDAPTEDDTLRAARAAAAAAQRALVRRPPAAAVLVEALHDVPEALWTDPAVRVRLTRAARRLDHLSATQRQTLTLGVREADGLDAFERLRALRPPGPREPEPEPADEASAGPSDPDPDPEADARRLLDAARDAFADAGAEAATDAVTRLSAWETLRSVAEDPDAPAAAAEADAALRVLEAAPGFAATLAEARRERAADDRYAVALNLLAADETERAEKVLREVRREHPGTRAATHADRALTALAAPTAP